MYAKRTTDHGYVGSDAGVDSGTEDELSTTRLPRVTPRPSISGQVMETESTQTPYANVSQVFNIWGMKSG